MNSRVVSYTLTVFTVYIRDVRQSSDLRAFYGALGFTSTLRLEYKLVQTNIIVHTRKLSKRIRGIVVMTIA